MRLKRVQRQRVKGKPGMPPNTLYVGRPTKYGNRYRVAWSGNGPKRWGVEDTKTGHFVIPNMGRMAAHLTCIDSYRAEMLIVKQEDPERYAELMESLKGYDSIACWCGVKTPCHGDVLIDLFEEYCDEQEKILHT